MQAGQYPPDLLTDSVACGFFTTDVIPRNAPSGSSSANGSAQMIAAGTRQSRPFPTARRLIVGHPWDRLLTR